jgi:hypothetical protein
VVTVSGKPGDHTTFYVLVPDLPAAAVTGAGVEHDQEKAKVQEVERALEVLGRESGSKRYRTDLGWVLVAHLSALVAQDVFPVVSGDLREARPYIVVNTALRRLGCGGRAALGTDKPK